MPDITDPEAIEFSEQFGRPMAQMVAWFQSTGNNMLKRWEQGGKNALFPDNATSPILDANAASSPYMGQDLHTTMTHVKAMLEILNAPDAMNGVIAGCVRALGPASGPQG